MHFPGKSIQEEPQIPLQDALFCYFDEVETSLDLEYVERINRERFAMYLGRACLRATDNMRVSKKHVTKARKIASEVSFDDEPMLGFRFVLQDIYGDMIHFRNNKGAFEKSREQHYDITMQALGFALRRVKAEPSNTAIRIGQINELTALAIFNRYCHPWMIALPALRHHDQGNRRCDNYDLLLVTSSPHSAGYSARKIQVKSSFNGSEDELREKYDDSIALLSARRRFGYRYDLASGGTNSEFPVAGKLLREYHGLATDEEIRELDIITDTLLFEYS